MLYVLLFVLIGSAQEVFLGNWFQSTHPLVVLVISFALTIIFFLSLIRKNIPQLLVKIREHGKVVLAVNIATLFGWLGFFMSLKYLEPAIVSTLCFAVGPLITLVAGVLDGTGSKPTVTDKISSIGISIGMFWLLYISMTGKSGVGIIDDNTIVALMWAVSSGIGVAFTTILSKRLNQLGFDSKEVLSTRLWLLVLVGAIFMPYNEEALTTANFWIICLILTALTVIFPIFLLQKGIETTRTILVSVILAAMPTVTYFLQILDDRLEMSPHTLAGIIFTTIFISLDVIKGFFTSVIERKA